MPIQEYEKIAIYALMDPDIKEGILKLQKLADLSYEEALFYVQSYKDIDYRDSKTLENMFINEKQNLVDTLALKIKQNSTISIEKEKRENKTFSDYATALIINPDIVESIQILSQVCNMESSILGDLIKKYKDMDHRNMENLDNHFLLQGKKKIINDLALRMQQRAIESAKKNR